MGIVSGWLLHLADPEGPNGAPPARPPSPAELARLFAEGEAHGVLPMLLANSTRLHGDDSMAAVRAAAVARSRAAAGLCLMLRQIAGGVMAGVAAAHIPARVVKGPVFAERLYPERTLRRFTDIDILVAPEGAGALAAVMSERGLFLAEAHPAAAPREWKWADPGHADISLEVQTDLVHAASLASAMSLRYADLAEDGECPAALLAIAAVHGAAHQFDRLLHVVDICQAARGLGGAGEEAALERLVARTGTRFAAVAGLALAGRLFSEPRCRAIAEGLGPVRHGAATRLLLGPAAVLSTRNDSRPWHSWRRSLFRELIKRSGREARG